MDYPGVYIEEIPNGVRPIPGVPTSITAFMGWTAKGSTSGPTHVANWSEFERAFGGIDQRSWLGYAVSHFFLNGGRDAYVVPLTGSGCELGTVLIPNTASFHSALAAALPQLERVDLFNLLCVPGETDVAQLATLASFCKDHRAFLIADCAQDATVQSVDDNLAILASDAATNAALYFPWITAADPKQDGLLRAFPACGFVAGIYARIDATRGVWKAPAGSEASVIGASGVAMPLTDHESGALNVQGVNGIRKFSAYGTVVWGARTLQGSDRFVSEWKYVPVRRMALFLEETLYRGTKWVVFEPNAEPLWAEIRLNVGAFMHNLFRQGAFQGVTPNEAYFVKCDGETTTQNDINRGLVNIVVGFAPLKRAEFVVIKIQQLAGQSERD